MSETGSNRNHGTQPLDALMIKHGVGNHDLVAASDEPITHKAVQRARKGRRLTPHMRRRVVAAMNKAVVPKGKDGLPPWEVSDLFNYV